MVSFPSCDIVPQSFQLSPEGALNLIQQDLGGSQGRRMRQVGQGLGGDRIVG